MKRFWDKVQKTEGCWLWTASKYKNGYGQFPVPGVSRIAHRVSWFLTYGSLSKDKEIMHSCDNRACVNPEHLSLGTHQENMKDMFIKGKNHRPRGELNGSSKIDLAAAAFIKYANMRPCDLAWFFNIDAATVCNIRAGRIWKHV